MSSVVFDSSALLAVIGCEAGAEKATSLLASAFMTSVNLAEMYSKATDLKLTIEDMYWAINRLPIEIVDFTAELALIAGSLREPTRHLGISLGDRSCLALAVARGLPVVTADQPWAALDVGVDVQLIR